MFVEPAIVNRVQTVRTAIDCSGKVCPVAGLAFDQRANVALEIDTVNIIVFLSSGKFGVCRAVACLAIQAAVPFGEAIQG